MLDVFILSNNTNPSNRKKSEPWKSTFSPLKKDFKKYTQKPRKRLPLPSIAVNCTVDGDMV